MCMCCKQARWWVVLIVAECAGDHFPTIFFFFFWLQVRIGPKLSVTDTTSSPVHIGQFASPTTQLGTYLPTLITYVGR